MCKNGDKLLEQNWKDYLIFNKIMLIILGFCIGTMAGFIMTKVLAERPLVI
jgi:hypothetical protein